MSDRIRMAESDRPPEENVEPQPAEEKPPPQQPEEPPRQDGPEPEPPAKEGEAEEAPQKFKDFAQRLERERREKWQARQEAEALQRQLREFQQQFQQWQQGHGAPPANQNLREQAKAELRQEMAVEEFNRQCDAVYAKGKAEFQDFDDAVQALLAVGTAQRPDFLAAVAQLPDAHRVYRQLASDLDNTARIMRLPPMQMAVELARMSVQPNGAPAPVSRAPPPIRPIGGGGQGPRRLQDVPMDEFVKRRDKEEAERRR